jgi:hypothetical protein
MLPGRNEPLKRPLRPAELSARRFWDARPNAPSEPPGLEVEGQKGTSLASAVWGTLEGSQGVNDRPGKTLERREEREHTDLTLFPGNSGPRGSLSCQKYHMPPSLGVSPASKVVRGPLLLSPVEPVLSGSIPPQLLPTSSHSPQTSSRKQAPSQDNSRTPASLTYSSLLSNLFPDSVALTFLLLSWSQSKGSVGCLFYLTLLSSLFQTPMYRSLTLERGWKGESVYTQP